MSTITVHIFTGTNRSTSADQRTDVHDNPAFACIGPLVEMLKQCVNSKSEERPETLSGLELVMQRQTSKQLLKMEKRVADLAALELLSASGQVQIERNTENQPSRLQPG